MTTVPAERRIPMPARTCQGFRRTCSTALSQYNTESICASCSYRRVLSIIADGNTRRYVKGQR